MKKYKYRMSYDYLFLPDSSDGFYYKGEKILSLELYFIFKAINKQSRKDFFFTASELKEQVFFYNELECCYINNFYNCFVNKNGYEMRLNRKIEKDSLYEISYELDECYKEDECGNPIRIPHMEFMDILLNNINEFDITTNKPTQSVACCMREVTMKNTRHDV